MEILAEVSRKKICSGTALVPCLALFVVETELEHAALYGTHRNEMEWCNVVFAVAELRNLIDVWIECVEGCGGVVIRLGFSCGILRLL